MPALQVPDRLTKAYLKKLPAAQLFELYDHLLRADDYLSYGESSVPNGKLVRTRRELERRGLL